MSEYEVLERGLAYVSALEQEHRLQAASLQRQAAADEARIRALEEKLRTHDELEERRREADALREASGDSLVLEQHEALLGVGEDLRLERVITSALRQQVDSALEERAALCTELAAYRRRLAAAGLLTKEELVGAQAAASAEAAIFGLSGQTPMAWEEVLQNRVRALEAGMESRDQELAALRTALDKSHTKAARARDESAHERAGSAAMQTHERLEMQLASLRSQLEAQEAQHQAERTALALSRERVREQERWLTRREEQLEAARREVHVFRESLQAARREIETSNRAAAQALAQAAQAAKARSLVVDGTGDGDGDGDGGEERALSATLRGQVAELEAELQKVSERAARQLTQERSEAERMRGGLRAAEEALETAHKERRQLLDQVAQADRRAAALDGEARTRMLEVHRLSRELGAMRARLQATAQEARAADDVAGMLQEQRALDERERQALQLKESLRDEMHSQLREALALESQRVAQAWEQRESHRKAKQAAYEALDKARLEVEELRQQLQTAADEVRELRKDQHVARELRRSAEEREGLHKRESETAKAEAAEAEATIIKLRAELESLSQVQLAAKQTELDAHKAELKLSALSVEHRDASVKLLQDELHRRSKELLALREEKRRVEGHARALVDGKLVAANEQLEAALVSAKLAAFERETANETVARLQMRLEGRGQEVIARGEQLRILQETSMLLTLENTLKDERLRSVEEKVQIEHTRRTREAAVVKRVRAEYERAQSTVLELSRHLATERERNTSLELRLGQRDEQMRKLLTELQGAELRGESREARMSLLRTKATLAAEDSEMFDSGLARLTSRLAKFEEELQQEREKNMLLLADVTQARAERESHGSDETVLRASLMEVQGLLDERDQQLAASNARLEVARMELQVQLAMIEEEVRGTQLQLDVKDVALQLQLEHAMNHEEHANKFMAEVSDRLKRAHDAMCHKDDLLDTLNRKLAETLRSLSTVDEQASALRVEAAAAHRAKRLATQQLDNLQERHALMQDDFKVATEALSNYRDTLVSAEVRMARDRERVASLQQQLRDLHAQIRNGASQPGTTITGAALLALSSLQGDTGEPATSRVHYLYFLSSLLLIKTALSQQGQMANVGAQDVFDEVVRNAVPLEEWPTYIFTRLYSAGGTADQKGKAMKKGGR